jgi:hypothetical protein
MSKPDNEKTQREPQTAYKASQPKEAGGKPFVVPEADTRPSPDASSSTYRPADAVPDEPLPPQD